MTQRTPPSCRLCSAPRRRRSICPTKKLSVRRSRPSTPVLGSPTPKSRSSPTPRKRGTTTTARPLADACSALTLVRSRSPSPACRPRQIRRSWTTWLRRPPAPDRRGNPSQPWARADAAMRRPAPCARGAVPNMRGHVHAPNHHRRGLMVAFCPRQRSAAAQTLV